MMASEGRLVTKHNAQWIADWVKGTVVTQHDALDDDVVIHAVNVPVFGDRVERAQPGDMVIRQHDGSFMVNKKE